jgi:hypothetical protein
MVQLANPLIALHRVTQRAHFRQADIGTPGAASLNGSFQFIVCHHHPPR